MLSENKLSMSDAADDVENTSERHGLTATGGGSSGSDSSMFTPGVLTRMQYAMYLFLAFVVCMLFKGGLGHFMSVKVIREACTAAGDTAQSHSCEGNLLVYRTSFALTLFFSLMFISVSDLTCCVDAKSRAEFQQKFFCWKSLVLNLFFLMVYWIPNGFFATYAWVCMFASAIFLVLQIILIVDFSYQWNEEWGDRSERNSKWSWYLMIVAGGGYLCGLAVTIINYIYFVPHVDCNANAFIITSVLISAVVYTMFAIWVPHGSIVPSGIVFGYTSIIVFTALRLSQDQRCNTLYSPPGEESWKMTLLGAIFSAGALAYSVISTGGSRTSVSLRTEEELNAEDPDETGHLANYCYFHGIMIMGAMYLAMIVTNWSVSGGSTSAETTSGVAMWVKVSSCWLTIFVYLWTLLAPYFCCKDRDFGIDTTGW